MDKDCACRFKVNTIFNGEKSFRSAVNITHTRRGDENVLFAK